MNIEPLADLQGVSSPFHPFLDCVLHQCVCVFVSHKHQSQPLSHEAIENKIVLNPGEKMVEDSMADSTAQEAESIKGAGTKRDGEFCESVSVTKKLKTGMDENQILQSSSGNKVKSDQDTKCLPEKSNTVVSCAIEADAAEDKGSRHTMEDAWVVLQDASLDFAGSLRCSYFAIFDGHGGRLAAEYVQKNLHRNVLSAGLPRELLDVKAAKRAILEGFRKTDESLLKQSTSGGWQDGATAVCVWILGQTVFVANVGDAKAVLARSSLPDGTQGDKNDSSTLKAIVLTREHKAIFPQERARIQKAGGSVNSNGRLQGRLEVSRAFGDRQFKKVGVIATPDIHSFDVTERDQFIILGCDGLWGVFGPSDAVEFVRKLLKEGLPVATVSRHLVREAVRERRCKDNCTAVVIVFRRKI